MKTNYKFSKKDKKEVKALLSKVWLIAIKSDMDENYGIELLPTTDEMCQFFGFSITD